jgi:hypothetical protein
MTIASKSNVSHHAFDIEVRVALRAALWRAMPILVTASSSAS